MAVPKWRHRVPGTIALFKSGRFRRRAAPSAGAIFVVAADASAPGITLGGRSASPTIGTGMKNCPALHRWPHSRQ
jgi:hypothetical protein